MSKKLSNKDKIDWENFISNKKKVPNKDLNLRKGRERNLTKIIDLHGYTLDEANNAISNFINVCYKENINKIIVITGKSLRSNKKDNPYVSKDLSILKYSVRDFIKSENSLISKILAIQEAKSEDGGSGAFYIFLKKKR